MMDCAIEMPSKIFFEMLTKIVGDAFMGVIHHL